MNPLAWTLVGALAVGGTATAAAVAADGTSSATVVRVVDGDTVDVRLDGDVERVRLLNIDAPETVDPNSPVECLGPEASRLVHKTLPPGTPVTLEYDVERTDRYGRTLASISLEDGTMVSTLVAAAGLAVPVTVGANDRFRAPVDKAFAHARAQHLGFFSPEEDCTVPAKVEHVSDATAAVSAGSATPKEYAALKSSTAALSTMLVAKEPGIAIRAMTWNGHGLVDATSTIADARNVLVTYRKHRKPKVEKPKPRTASPSRRPATSAPPQHSRPSPTTRRSSAPPAPRPTTHQPPAPQQPAPQPTTHEPPSPPQTPPPAQETHDPVPPNPDWHCRSYAPGGKTFKYIPCD